MNNKKYRIETKMACCTQPPWRNIIDPSDRAEILRKIKQECIDEYGYAFDVCPKSLLCLEKKCMGRPLPWKSETAQPYLAELKKTQTFILNEETGEEELQIITDCKLCEVYKDCKVPCRQVNDFLERDVSQTSISNNFITYKDNLENIVPVQLVFGPINLKVSEKDLAWDVLSKENKEIIKRYLYDERDYRSIAEKLGLFNQSYCKCKFYYALTRLAKFSIIRMFLKENLQALTDRQQQIMIEVYMNNKTYKKVAKELNISIQSVHETITRVVKNHNIRWPKFVRKTKGKIVYNVPKLFK